MKKITFIFLLFLILGFFYPVRAEKITSQKKADIFNTVKNAIKSFMPMRIHGTLKSLTGQTLIVDTDTGDITVYIVGKTLLKRRYGGASNLSEFMVGDELAVLGKKHKTTGNVLSESEMDAKYIRNLSIQRRNAVILGIIKTKSDTSFTVQTEKKGLQTVFVSAGTSLTEKDKPITYAELSDGNRILVKGELWDRAHAKIDAKRIVKLNQNK